MAEIIRYRTDVLPSVLEKGNQLQYFVRSSLQVTGRKVTPLHSNSESQKVTQVKSKNFRKY